MTTVIVTEEEYGKAQAVFTGAADLHCVPSSAEESELARTIRENGAKHAIVGVVRYQGELYSALPRGGVLARFGVGHDGIDKRKATEAGLLCTNTPGALDFSVAETTMMLLLASARRLPRIFEAARNGVWTTSAGQELAGKTLAIIGCGRIGCAVARIAAFGFGMRVTGCETRLDRVESLRSEVGIQTLTQDFAEAVSGADFVSLHIPANPSTAHFMNAERLAVFPRNSWLINTARGSVVDENALYDALAQNRIAGAALDVFEREPYEPADPSRDLRALPNVILTPHVASNTTEANRRMAERALRNISLAESGNWKAMDLLNPEVLHQEQVS
ncbi:MAG: NAD(P)-dependent oxidoreductase [Bryobacteraceae bacterium]|jgi:phosphoglycerate dehydrogenase-like enzyme